VRGITRFRSLIGADWFDTTTAIGLNVRAKAGTPAWGRLQRFGWYELDTELFLRHAVRPGDVVVDVGVNEGVLAVTAAKLGAGAVIGFDPDPAPLAIARQALEQNQLTNVELRQEEVGASPGHSLDDLVPAADVIKIDVDGPELEILRGAERLLGTRPRLVVEISADTDSGGVLELLRQRGYHVHASRMKFPHVLPLDSLADLEALPVRLEQGDAANLYCTPEPLDRGAVWPPSLVVAAYRKHFLSEDPYPSPELFWRAYKEQIDSALTAAGSNDLTRPLNRASA
jgi:precorrin-6B methylase 2